MQNHIQSYEIIKPLGYGGMGVVNLAKHSLFGELVAIKTLSHQFALDPAVKERFKKEAQILYKLNHPNIVKVKDFIDDGSGLHIVMEYVEGKPLDKIIGQEVGPIPHDKALPLFLQILDGIGYAHSQGVIHRDLKPGNIIVTPDNRVKITDFGIARIEGQTVMTKTGTKMGTLYYMSPEQVRGEHTDEQSDIYSLGMTLYEMLAGQLPFERSEAVSEFALMNSIVNEELKDPREFYPHIPKQLVDIIKESTAKLIVDRIKSIKEFMQLILIVGEGQNRNEINAQIENDIGELSLGTVIAKKPVTKEVEHDGDGLVMGSNRKIDKNSILKRKGVIIFLAITIIGVIYLYNKDSYPEMVFVQGGTFMMGNNEGYNDEKPVHRVTLDDYYIGKYEVTFDEYDAYCDAAGKEKPNDEGWGRGKRPVINVNWDDANEYCKWLSEKSGLHYRLPTEAEWEYAARGGSQSNGYKYSGGDDINSVAWYAGNSGINTHPVGEKGENELRLHDMSGNVWEWCNDWYDESYYSKSPEWKPPGPEYGSSRVIRGGSWINYDYYCAVSARLDYNPELRDDNYGFRLFRNK